MDFRKKLFQARPYSPFMDLRKGSDNIVSRETLTVGELIEEAIPTLKTLARDYLFQEGKAVNYFEIIKFLDAVAIQINPTTPTEPEKKESTKPVVEEQQLL